MVLNPCHLAVLVSCCEHECGEERGSGKIEVWPCLSLCSNSLEEMEDFAKFSQGDPLLFCLHIGALLLFSASLPLLR